MASPALPAGVFDPHARRVELSQQRWDHIIAGHPELAPFMAAVLQAVQTPTRMLPGTRTGEEWFYLEGIGPSRWLKVVVSYEASIGRIITAFARRSHP